MREPAVIERVVVFADRRQANGELTNGYCIDFANMISGAGWISAGPGYRKWYGKDSLFVDASAAISRREYRMAQGRVELPKLFRSRLAVGSQVRLRDFMQVNYFGEGPGSLESNVSEYRLASRDLVGYATLRPVEWLAVGASIGWLKPNVKPRAGFFERDRPGTQELFPGNIVFSRPEQPSFVHGHVSMTAQHQIAIVKAVVGVGPQRLVVAETRLQIERHDVAAAGVGSGEPSVQREADARAGERNEMRGFDVISTEAEEPLSRSEKLAAAARYSPPLVGWPGLSRVSFILGMNHGYVRFAYDGWYRNLVRDRITADDVVWASSLLGRLSDRQWNDAFRAAGYEPETAERFIRKLRGKIEQGRAAHRLAATSPSN